MNGRASALASVALAAVVALAVMGTWRGASAGGSLGDASCDGNVNAIDAALILQYAARLLPSLDCSDVADTNRDGLINSIDAQLILQYYAGLMESLPPVPATDTPTPIAPDTPTSTPIPTAMPTSTPTPLDTPTITPILTPNLTPAPAGGPDPYFPNGDFSFAASYGPFGEPGGVSIGKEVWNRGGSGDVFVSVACTQWGWVSSAVFHMDAGVLVEVEAHVRNTCDWRLTFTTRAALPSDVSEGKMHVGRARPIPTPAPTDPPPTPGPTSPTLRIGSLELAVGEQDSVPLEVLNFTDGRLGSWTVHITYDPSMLSVIDCVPQHDGACNEAYGANTVRVTGASAFGLGPDAELATITLRCDAPGTSALSISISVLHPAYARVEDGSVTCTVPSPALYPAFPILTG